MFLTFLHIAFFSQLQHPQKLVGTGEGNEAVRSFFFSGLFYGTRVKFTKLELKFSFCGLGKGGDGAKKKEQHSDWKRKKKISNYNVGACAYFLNIALEEKLNNWKQNTTKLEKKKDVIYNIYFVGCLLCVILCLFVLFCFFSFFPLFRFRIYPKTNYVLLCRTFRPLVLATKSNAADSAPAGTASLALMRKSSILSSLHISRQTRWQ